MWTFVCAPLFTVNVTVIKVELETLVVVLQNRIDQSSFFII